jgi:hypothetical protein
LTDFREGAMRLVLDEHSFVVAGIAARFLSLVEGINKYTSSEETFFVLSSFVLCIEMFTSPVPK